MASIRPSHVQALVKALSVELAPATVKTIYRFTSAVFRAAVRDRLIARTPCEGITLPRQDRDHKIVPLEVDQLAAVAELMPERWRAAVWVAAGTGLRQGEVLGLTVEGVDFLRRQVKVDRQLVAGRGVAFAPPKTKASYRTVPLPESIAVVLAEHLRQFPASEEGLIFTTTGGGPVQRQRLADAWRAAAGAVGLPPRTGFHATGTSTRRRLSSSAESVKVVQSRLGHASALETLDTYGHLWPDSEDTTRAAIDKVLGNSAGWTRDAAAADG